MIEPAVRQATDDGGAASSRRQPGPDAWDASNGYGNRAESGPPGTAASFRALTRRLKAVSRPLPPAAAPAVTSLPHAEEARPPSSPGPPEAEALPGQQETQPEVPVGLESPHEALEPSVAPWKDAEAEPPLRIEEEPTAGDVPPAVEDLFAEATVPAEPRAAKAQPWQAAEEEVVAAAEPGVTPEEIVPDAEEAAVEPLAVAEETAPHATHEATAEPASAIEETPHAALEEAAAEPGGMAEPEEMPSAVPAKEEGAEATTPAYDDPVVRAIEEILADSQESAPRPADDWDLDRFFAELLKDDPGIDDAEVSPPPPSRSEEAVAAPKEHTAQQEPADERAGETQAVPPVGPVEMAEVSLSPALADGPEAPEAEPLSRIEPVEPVADAEAAQAEPEPALSALGEEATPETPVLASAEAEHVPDLSAPAVDEAGRQPAGGGVGREEAEAPPAEALQISELATPSHPTIQTPPDIEGTAAIEADTPSPAADAVSQPPRDETGAGAAEPAAPPAQETPPVPEAISETAATGETLPSTAASPPAREEAEPGGPQEAPERPEPPVLEAAPAEAVAPTEPGAAAAMPSAAEDAAASPPEAPGAVGEPEPEPPIEAPQTVDPASGETARMLLDIMSLPAGAAQPQERALAADTILRLIDRMPVPSLLALCERLCMMETPPPLLVKRLISHPNVEVAGALLEKCAAISDQDLLELSESGDTAKLRMIARRRRISQTLGDALIRLGDASVLLTLVRNPGAQLSHEAFVALSSEARTRPALQAPLATRADTPPTIAFELFWFLPPELRRYVLSRFLTDSATLNRILRIASSVDEATASIAATELKFPDSRRLEELVSLIEEGMTGDASHLMSELAGICAANARRIITDPDGEPLIVVMKALGMPRARFAAAAERWRLSSTAVLRPERSASELQALFDTLSYNKARVLLTYWDWAVRQAGPYARQAA